jgi:hypothetical protein
MKSIFDSSFKYKPSFDTDLRQTFFRVRQEQQAQIRGRSTRRFRKTSRQAKIPQAQPDTKGSSPGGCAAA